MQQRTRSASAAWGLGLAACLCNFAILLMPVGIILGIIALLVARLSPNLDRSAKKPAYALAGLSFLIAAVWAATVLAVYLLDETLLG